MILGDQYTPTTEMFVYPLITLFAGNILLFLFCQSPWGKRDNSWIDAMWSLSFVTPNAVVLILRLIESENNEEAKITARMWICSVPVLLWGLRLSSYIFFRHTREDYRYKQMREDWEAQGTCVYYLKAFFYIFIGQGIFSLINNSSALYVNLYSKHDPGNDGITVTDIVGVSIWALGFLIEITADR